MSYILNYIILKTKKISIGSINNKSSQISKVEDFFILSYGRIDTRLFIIGAGNYFK